MTIVFLHIPKTAGSFVDSQVRKSSAKSFHEIQSREALLEKLPENPEYLAGHFTFEHINGLLDPDRHHLSTLVRNPVDRFFSDANYHIEILRRGKDFFYRHGPGVRNLILKTYSAAFSGENDQVSVSSLDHLYGFGFEEYLASRMLSTSVCKNLVGIDPLGCFLEIKKTLDRYSFLEFVENGGVEKFLDYIVSNSEISFDSNSREEAFCNKSCNWINPCLRIEPLAELIRGKCNLSNMIFLIMDGKQADFFEGKTWAMVNEIAAERIISSSKYLRETCYHKPPAISWFE